MVTTIAERVVWRHFVNHLRFKHTKRIRKSEEEEKSSPLSSSSESEDEDQCLQAPPATLSYEELFRRNDEDCIQRVRLLPPSFGGIGLLRKRWLNVRRGSQLTNDYWMKHYSQWYSKVQVQYLVPHPDPSASSVAVSPILTRDDCDNWLDVSHFAFIGCSADEVNAFPDVPEEVPDVPEDVDEVQSDIRSVHPAPTSRLPSLGNESLIAGVPCVSPCCFQKGDFPAPEVHCEPSGDDSVSRIPNESLLNDSQ
jgi:hypothetical protein